MEEPFGLTDDQKKIWTFRGIVLNRLMGKLRQSPNRREDAEELAQEVMRKAFRYFNGFRGEAALSSWIFKITETTFLDYYRKQKSHAYDKLAGRISIDDPEEWRSFEGATSCIYYEDAITTINTDRTRQLVTSALEEIPSELRTIIIRRHFYEDTFRQIADLLGIPLGTAKARYRRGIERMRRKIISLPQAA